MEKSYFGSTFSLSTPPTCRRKGCCSLEELRGACLHLLGKVLQGSCSGDPGLGASAISSLEGSRKRPEVTSINTAHRSGKSHPVQSWRLGPPSLSTPRLPGAHPPGPVLPLLGDYIIPITQGRDFYSHYTDETSPRDQVHPQSYKAKDTEDFSSRSQACSPRGPPCISSGRRLAGGVVGWEHMVIAISIQSYGKHFIPGTGNNEQSVSEDNEVL